MYETASKRVKKSKRCVLFVTFRPSQRTLFMARRNWVPLALRAKKIFIRKTLGLTMENASRNRCSRTLERSFCDVQLLHTIHLNRILLSTSNQPNMFCSSPSFS